jgi:hypothetical protein
MGLEPMENIYKHITEINKDILNALFSEESDDD